MFPLMGEEKAFRYWALGDKWEKISVRGVSMGQSSDNDSVVSAWALRPASPWRTLS